MLMRQALPGGVPWWQPWLSLVGVAAWAFATIWVAARIFRIGILSRVRDIKVEIKLPGVPPSSLRIGR
jgi:hypothetical protein